MKSLISVLCVVLIACGVAYADYKEFHEYFYGGEEEKKVESICPHTRMDTSCRTCHYVNKEGKWDLREIDPDTFYKYPFDGVKIRGDAAYLVIEDIYSDNLVRFCDYVKRHPEIKKVVFEIYSFGGSVMGAWRMIGHINELRGTGVIIETRCYGIAASAGFVLLVSGDIGHRYVSPTAELMFHELWTIDWLKISTPSSKEHEAEVMRHFQDNIVQWIVSRSTNPEVTKEWMDAKVQYEDYWLTGADAINMGFADLPIGRE